MLNGHPVRVKIGRGICHIVHLSQEQAKKLHKASIKGSGFTIRMDPYQIVQHRNLQGQGILSHLKSTPLIISKNTENISQIKHYITE